ncbi:MAG: magnesium transporter CorA family protein [Chloroflexi bacterium]|nr:magnesium transporter CorA family protein [Chloroflexota bacterium]
MARPIAVEEKRERNIEQITWNGLIWVNIERPTNTEITYLAREYHFHPLDLDDCLSRRQRPKMDEYEDYLFIVLHFPVFNKEAGVTVPSQVSIFIGKNYLVTVHQGALKPLVKLFKDCQLDEEARQKNMRSSGYLLYHLIDILVDYCFPIADKIMENLEKVEDDLFDPTTPDPIEALAGLRRDIISYRRIFWPMRTLISSLGPKTKRFTKEDLEVYWGDVTDHAEKIWDTLDECKETIEGLNDTGSILASHHLNVVIRIFTVVAVVLLIPTIIVGAYGMNIGLPGGYDEDSLITFSIIMVVMIGIIGFVLYLFRRRRWI